MSSEQKASRLETAGRFLKSLVLLPGRTNTSAAVEAAIDGLLLVQHLPRALEGDHVSIASIILGGGSARFLRWAFTGGIVHYGGRDYRAHF